MLNNKNQSFLSILMKFRTKNYPLKIFLMMIFTYQKSWTFHVPLRYSDHFQFKHLMKDIYGTTSQHQ